MKEEKEVKQVTQFVNELQFNLEELVKELDTLTKNLEPIMRVEYTTEEKEVEKAVELVPLATQIRGNFWITLNCRRKVQFILEHLEL